MPQNRDRDPKRNEFRRMLGVSVGLHVLVLVVLMVSPAPSAIAPPQAISVDLVAFAPPATSVRVPEPAPAPAPAEVEPIPAEPEPEAPRPKPAEVVLPERPTEPKPKPQAEKPKPKPTPQREVVLKPKPKVEQSLEDLLAEMREETGEPRPEPIVEAAVAPEAPRGGGVRVSPEEAAWKARVKARIRRTWVVPFDFRDQALEAHVMITIDPSGALAAPPKITRGSGNLAYDDGILDGIRRADPLPAPPEPGPWPFVFTSEDY